MATIREEKRQTKSGTSTKYILDYRDIAGRRFKERFYSKAEAKKRLVEIEYHKSIGVNLRNNKKLKFKEASDIFFNTHAQNLCKPSTLASYQSYLKKHLNPYFGNISMFKITPLLIEEFKKEKLATLSPKSVNHCLTLVSTIYETMIREGLILQNPIKLVKKARMEHKEMMILNRQEIKNMLVVSEELYPDFYALLFTAFLTGMRRNELLSLTWADINFRNKTLRVNKTLFKGEVHDPKTKASIRTLQMPNELVSVLQAWKKECTEGVKNIVFPNANGEYQDPDNMVKRRFKKVAKRALPKPKKGLRFHDLRHCCASLMISKNVPMRLIKQHLGHSSITTTMDRYGHLMPETDKFAVNAMDELFGVEIKKARRLHIAETYKDET